MHITTICGSSRFFKEILFFNYKLASAGEVVLAPTPINPESINKDSLSFHVLKNLFKSQLKKIEMSDSIFVVDKDGYIGDHTRMEIEHAEGLGKAVRYASIEFRNELELL